MKNKLGVMQGRLLPKYKGRFQAHPVGYWEKEFELAKNYGLDNIEFILDYNNAKDNPLLNSNGISEILSLSVKTGVNIKTICADYFMESPFHSENEKIVKKSQKTLSTLIYNTKLLGLTDIIVPCVDQSALKDQKAKDLFVKNITPLLETFENHKVNLCLETDLSPISFAAFLKMFNSKYVTVNYDIGNSAYFGYDPIDELNAYGKKISDIHIKDRKLGGESVVLGKGDADFSKFFTKLKEFNYKGPFIMQAYRDEEGLNVFKKQLDFIKPYLSLIE